MKKLETNPISILFCYDRVLKDPDFFILKIILKQYTDQFKEYLDLERVNTLSDAALQEYLKNRKKVNILEDLAIKEFDYEKNYKHLYDKFKNLYRDSLPLRQYGSLKFYLKSYCIRSIYVYNETDDIRQRYDLATNTKENQKLIYVTGNSLKDVIQSLKEVELLFDWSAKRVAELNESNELGDIFFGVADYSFNFDPDKPYALKYGLHKRSNVGVFPGYELSNTSKFKG